MASYIYSEDFLEAYAEILVECWSDEEFAARFKSDPMGVLKEWEIELGEEITKIVVVDTDETGVVSLALPPAPAGFDELSDEDLDAVAGGSAWQDAGAVMAGTGAVMTGAIAVCK